MFQLQLAHLDRADREREVEADLQRRRLLKLGGESGPLGPERSSATTNPRTTAPRVPATQR